MKASLLNIEVIKISKYEYHKLLNKVTHIEHKREFGYYIPDIHVWIPEDLFNNYFIINEG